MRTLLVSALWVFIPAGLSVAFAQSLVPKALLERYNTPPPLNNNSTVSTNGSGYRVDSSGITLLHKAAIASDYYAVEALLADGAQVNTATTLGTTPLHWLAQNCHPGILMLLLGNGAKPMDTIPYSGGLLPLDLMICSNSEQCVKIMVSYGVLRQYNSLDKQTRLVFSAAKCGATDVLVFLLTELNQVDIQSVIENGSSILSLSLINKIPVSSIAEMIKQISDINKPDNNGMTLLHIAALYSDTPVLKLLLDSGADPNLKSNMNQTPMELANSFGNTPNALFLKSYTKP